MSPDDTMNMQPDAGVMPDASAPHEPVLPGDLNGDKPGEVNLIFRGLFVFVDHSDYIEVLIPNMMDHIYRAGGFLMETTMEPLPHNQPYILGGVIAGKRHFRDDSDAVVWSGRRPAEGLSADDLHSRIILPLPKEILSLRLPKKACVATIDPLGLIHNRKLPCVHIFRYDTKLLDAVKLFRHNSQPPVHTMEELTDHPIPQFKNFHIVAEPDHKMDDDHQHVSDAVAKAASLIEGLQGGLEIDGNKVEGLEDPPRVCRDKGFVPIETLTMKETLAMLGEAGKQWRMGKPVLPQASGHLHNDPPITCQPFVIST